MYENECNTKGIMIYRLVRMLFYPNIYIQTQMTKENIHFDMLK